MGQFDIEVGNMRQRLAKLEKIKDAAQEFVSTTSYYRQRKESKPEFEKLAFALLDLRQEDA